MTTATALLAKLQAAQKHLVLERSFMHGGEREVCDVA